MAMKTIITPECRTPPSQWQKLHKIDPDEFKTTSITSNGCNRPLDTGEVATASLNASIHSGQLEISETNWRRWRVTDIEDDDHEYRTWSIERDHQPKHIQWTEWPYPWMPQYWKPKAESRDYSQVSTVTTTILLFERSALIPVCMYTYSSSNLEEAHMQKHSTANLRILIPMEEDLARMQCTYRGDTIQIKQSYRHECLHNWSALMKTLNDWSSHTVTNISTSEVHVCRWHPTIEGHWGWEGFPPFKRTYSGDTLRSVKCICCQWPKQFRRPTTMTTMTRMTSEHKDYGQSRWQSANQAPTTLRHSASKSYWRHRHYWWLWTKMLSQSLCGTETTDSTHRGREIQIPDRNGKMQCVRVIIDCGATTIFLTPRLLKWLGISHQAALVTTLAMTGGVMQHAKDTWKTRITVQYFDYLAPVDRSDVLVVPMRAYDLVLGLSWFPKHNPDIDWARSTPCDHRVRVARRNDTDDYGSGIEGLTNW